MLPSKIREITFPTFGISFQTPEWLVTQKELGQSPLLLTADNTLYIECELPDPVSPGNHVEMCSELYMVDFAKKTYPLVKTCDNTWESKVTCY